MVHQRQCLSSKRHPALGAMQDSTSVSLKTATWRRFGSHFGTEYWARRQRSPISLQPSSGFRTPGRSLFPCVIDSSIHCMTHYFIILLFTSLHFSSVQISVHISVQVLDKEKHIRPMEVQFSKLLTGASLETRKTTSTTLFGALALLSKSSFYYSFFIKNKIFLYYYFSSLFFFCF